MLYYIFLVLIIGRKIALLTKAMGSIGYENGDFVLL
jgi:hypothetical protein